MEPACIWYFVYDPFGVPGALTWCPTGRYGARTKTANGEIKIPEFLAATDDTRAGIMEVLRDTRMFLLFQSDLFMLLLKQHREARKSTMSDIANDQRKFRVSSQILFPLQSLLDFATETTN